MENLIFLPFLMLSLCFNLPLATSPGSFCQGENTRLVRCSALDLVRRKYPGFHREKRLRFPDSIPAKNETRWFAGPSHWIASKTSTRSFRRQCNANPRTIPTPPKTAYTNTMFEPHPYTRYIPVPDLAPHPQNQDIQTLPLLTPAERAWLAAQHDLAREPDYWRPVRWL
ncbi:hypothetical protein K438DRAFT_1772823 [Mycena galopus ATCC 62051]|nr:hypothetical protein K438DRAFT_1772823 [Mycena galopus ATCC 62051]